MTNKTKEQKCEICNRILFQVRKSLFTCSNCKRVFIIDNKDEEKRQ